MSSKNQTAVEWLVQEIENQCPQIDISWKENLINQAKAMEKQQIADAFDYEAKGDMHDYSSGDQYYDNTFL
jgi:predicted alpha/beta-fold hydrolase